MKHNKIINRDISQKDLLKFLSLPEDTKVYCDEMLNINLYNEIFVRRGLLPTGEYVFSVGYKTKPNGWGYYFLDFKYKNEYGPSRISINECRERVVIIYYKNGKYHRAFKPAYIEYDFDGNIIREEHYLSDKLHNRVGPAIIHHSSWNSKVFSYFYIDNKEINLDTFCKLYEKNANR